MTKKFQARILISFNSEPSVETAMDIMDTMFATSKLGTLPMIEPQQRDGTWFCDYAVQWQVPDTFDADKFVNEVHASDENIGAVIAINMDTMYAGYTMSRSRGTNEYDTRWLLSRFVNDMISATMGSFDTIVPSSQLPTVIFN